MDNPVIPKLKSHPDALFALEVIPPTGYSLPGKIEVSFEAKFGLYCCPLKEKVYTGYLRTAEVKKDATVQKLTPMFNYWVNVQKTTLTGVYDQNYFYVTSAATLNIKKEQTEMFIRRLLASDAPAASDTGKPAMLCRPLTGLEELLTFYHILGHTLPGELYDWFGSELENYKQTNSYTQKNQAIHAISMVAAIDWSSHAIKTPSIETVRAELDAELYGMEAVKEQLCEIVAMVNRSKKIPKWGILLVGPPGIGKTCIARLFARVFGLPFASVDFSSLRDDEGLTGSFRLYENSRPGYIFNSLFNVRSATALLLCNEIDKAQSARKSGSRDPTTVLLSLLDRTGFWENFLDCTARFRQLRGIVCSFAA